MTVRKTDQRADNIFKVPAKQWRKWTLVGRHVFNKTLETALRGQGLFVPPGGEFVSDKQWRIQAWNFAFISADICSRGERILLKNIEKEIKPRGTTLNN